MQVKSKIAITLSNGIKIECDPDQIGDVMKNIPTTIPSIPDIPQYIPNYPWWYPDIGGTGKSWYPWPQIWYTGGKI